MLLCSCHRYYASCSPSTLPSHFPNCYRSEIYQEILGFRFEEVEKPYVWHEDVRLFSVYDKDSNDFVGHFYLDLYPRDGKYTHAAAFPLQPTAIKPDGSRQHPAAAMVSAAALVNVH
jgi:Zn-dependent oligopeptidase